MSDNRTTIASVEADKHQDQVIKNLKLALLHTGFTQKDVLKKAGLSNNVLYAFFAKKSNMTLINLLAICKVIEIDPSSIISQRELTSTQIKFNKSLNLLDESKIAKVMSILEDL